MAVLTDSEVARATRTLSAGTFKEKLALLRELPVCPPSDAGMSEQTPQVALKSPYAVDNRAKKFLSKKKLSRDKDCIAFVKFKAVPAGYPEEGSLTFSIKYASDLRDDASRQGWVPIWFLPWESGFMWKVKLKSVRQHPTITLDADATPVNRDDPTQGTRPVHGTAAVANPGLFFTAAINGCSVFARGEPAEPRLYHGGVDETELQALITQIGQQTWNNLGGTAEELWRRLFEGLTDDGAGGLRQKTAAEHKSRAMKIGGGKVTGEVNKTHYIKETGKEGTQLARHLDHFLRHNSKEVRAEGVRPWGCVFGLRDDRGQWEFHLQNNATVTYYTLQKRSFLGIPQKPKEVGITGRVKDLDTDEWSVKTWPKKHSVFLGCRQFYPHAVPLAKIPFDSLRFF